MRTTFDLPDPLFRRAKAMAAVKGMKFKDLLQLFVERGLNEVESRQAAPTKRTLPPPVVPATGVPIAASTNSQLEEILVQEDAKRDA